MSTLLGAHSSAIQSGVNQCNVKCAKYLKIIDKCLEKYLCKLSGRLGMFAYATH